MRAGRKTLLRLALLVAVPLAAIGLAGAWWLSSGRWISTENAYVKADIAQIAPEVAGRVIEVRVRDHATVRAGDVLLRLDPQPFRLALEKAEAELDAARTQIETLRATWREATSELAEAESRLAFFTKQMTRAQELANRGVASQSKLDEATHDAQSAADKLATVKEKLQRVQTALGGDPEIPTDRHPVVREKRALRDRMAYDLERTTIVAALDGVAVNVKVQVGEQIRAATPIFALVADRRPWVEANFKETELTHVRVGQVARVVLDIYPDVTWEAVVESLSPATGAEFALLPPQNASGNWVKVVQRLPVKLRLTPQGGEPPLRAGMTATVRIDTGRQRSLGDVTTLVSGRRKPQTDAQARTP